MNKKILKISVVVSLLLFISVAALFAQEGASGVRKKILLVHSYHAEYPWVASITRGVMEAVKDSPVAVEIFYMDTKRQTTQEWKAKSGKLAIEKIEQWQPDVVICADDNAQIFVTQKYAGKEKPQFVFCGVNGEPADYGLLVPNVTGIVERPHFNESLDYLKIIIPNIRKAAVISDDGPTSIGAMDFIGRANPEIKILDYHLIGSFDVWKQRIIQYNVDADVLCVYMYHTVKDKGAEQSLLPKDVMVWTRINCMIPTIGFFDFAIEDGLLCGVVESGEEHGWEAANMALQILNGTSPGTLPIKTAQKGLKMVNLKTAKHLGISIPEQIIKEADKVVE
ncbi:MAG: ABC transporter substrate binding protein [Candidatus Omnitrophota bacterium]